MESEAVYPAFFMVEDVDELISAREAYGIEDGPPRGPALYFAGP
jgi:hypothetical protein